MIFSGERKMNKYKKLAFNTVIFAIGSFGSKILVILLTRLYSRHLDPVSSGIKELLEPTALFLQPIFTFALQEYLIRFGLDKNCDKREVFTTSGAMTFAGMLLMALTVPILSLIPAFNYIKGYTLLLIVYILMSSLRMLCQQFVRSQDMVKLFSLDGILATLTLFIFNLLFIAGFHWGVRGFMLAVILSDLFSSLFYILLLVAALTSAISMHEMVTALLHEKSRLTRPQAAVVVALCAMVCATACSLSFGPWRNVTLLGMGFFDLFDFVTAKFMMPIGGLCFSVFAAWVMKRQFVERELCGERPSRSAVWAMKVICLLMRYIAPICLVGVFFYELWSWSSK